MREDKTMNILSDVIVLTQRRREAESAERHSKTLRLCVSQIAVVVVCAGAAFADSATDSAIRMEETGIAVFGHSDYAEPTAAYPTAASGTSADEDNYGNMSDLTGALLASAQLLPFLSN